MAELVVFDWKRTLYDPERKVLIEGSLSVLQHLGIKGLRMYLVGKDSGGDMLDEVRRLGVSAFFQAIHFVKESKTDDDIGQFINPDSPEEAVVVGDRVRSEITVGNRLGATTVWVEQGRFASEQPVMPEQIPDYTIRDIVELVPLCENL